MSSEEHLFDLLPAYALGSLDPVEEQQVNEHLASCAICRAELETYDGVVQNLPLAMVQSAPSSDLKRKVLAHARKATISDKAMPAQTLWQRLSLAIRAGAPIWGIAGLILILILGVSNLFLWGRLNEIERATRNVLITIPMQGTDINPQAVGMLVVSADGEHGTLVVDGLPILEINYQYQLWLIRDGQRTNGGVFSVDEEGYGNLWITSPDPLLSYTAYGVTIEPAGGSPGPTGKKVLGGEL